MVATQLFSELHQLDRADKLRVMQFLVTELAHEEGTALKLEGEYPIWSPYNAYEAASVMLNLLNSDMSSEPHAA